MVNFVDHKLLDIIIKIKEYIVIRIKPNQNIVF